MTLENFLLTFPVTRSVLLQVSFQIAICIVNSSDTQAPHSVSADLPPQSRKGIFSSWRRSETSHILVEHMEITKAQAGPLSLQCERNPMEVKKTE